MSARHLKPLGLTPLGSATLRILACVAESHPVERKPIEDNDSTTPQPAADPDGYPSYDVDLNYWLPLFGIGGVMDASAGGSFPDASGPTQESS
jgi:hypothetical protein